MLSKEKNKIYIYIYVCAPCSVGKQKEKNNKMGNVTEKLNEVPVSRSPARPRSAGFQLLFLVSVPGTKVSASLCCARNTF